MESNATMSKAALQALIALCEEALFQGGSPRGVTMESIEEALAVITQGKTITIEE